ncbi:hypothetical protein JTB14_002634 [Gonioctena quinquepunctata]|nr:hypothetical protein JTB14_002634 [Gonioctena quinquepunctata]
MKIDLQQKHYKIEVNKMEITNLKSRFIVEKLKELEEQSETDIEAEEDLRDLNDQLEETQPGTSQSNNRKETEKKCKSPQTTTGGKQLTRRNTKN